MFCLHEAVEESLYLPVTRRLPALARVLQIPAVWRVERVESSGPLPRVPTIITMPANITQSITSDWQINNFYELRKMLDLNNCLCFKYMFTESTYNLISKIHELIYSLPFMHLLA